MSQPADGPASEAEEEGVDAAALQARIEALEEENSQLRSAYAAARRSQYRRAALGLAAVGVLAALLAIALPQARTVLFSLAGIGLFGAVLTFYLTPERFVAADVVEHVQEGAGETYGDLVRELDLQRTQVFVPTDSEAGPAAWLFIPHHPEWSVPDPQDLESRLLVTEDRRTRGLSIRPSGAGLYASFERSVAEPVRTEPAPLGRQLGDALVEDFELADGVDVDAGEGRLSMAVTAPAFGSLSAIDHPIASFLAVGVAAAREAPTVVSVETDTEGDPIVTLRWVREDSEA